MSPKTTLIPVHDLLLVEPEEQKQTASGLVLPETAQTDGQAGRGLVLRAGPGRYNSDGQRIPMSVEAGVRITYKPFAGVPIEHDGRRLRLMSEQDVLAMDGIL